MVSLMSFSKIGDALTAQLESVTYSLAKLIRRASRLSPTVSCRDFRQPYHVAVESSNSRGRVLLHDGDKRPSSAISWPSCRTGAQSIAAALLV